MKRSRLLELPIILCIALAGTVAAQEKLMFSPNGDGIKDDVTFKLTLGNNEGISSWLFEIHDQDKRLVQKFSGSGMPPASLKWDGKDSTNNLVRDGTYYYSLSLVTPAGNSTAIAESPIIVDRVPPLAEATVVPQIFAPHSQSGLSSQAQFHLKGTDENGIYSWLLTIKDNRGALAKSIGARGTPPEVVPWDGRGVYDEDLPDGIYTFDLTVEDNAGNRTTTPTKVVTIRRKGVNPLVDAAPSIFSPNGDGYKDEVVFTITSAQSELVQQWTLKIFNRSGRMVHAISGLREPPRHIVWDGQFSDKKVAPDGDYAAVFYEMDAAGNSSVSKPAVVTIDTTPPTVIARFEPSLISPGKHGFHDSGVFYLKAEDKNPLQSWALKIVNDVGRPVKTISGPSGSKPTEKTPWIGDGDDGMTLPDGVYNYFLEAVDVAGNRGITQKQQVRIDTTPPLVSISADSTLFSPTAEGAEKELILTLSVQDASPIHSWNLNINDVQGNVVRNFTGQPDVVPQQIRWNGKNQNRTALRDGDYFCVLSAMDAAGNKSVSQGLKVTIGSTKPIPAVSVDNNAISPNADGFKDVATFLLHVKSFIPIKDWAFRISSDRGSNYVRTFQGRGNPPDQLQWGGENDLKRVLPDGDYYYTFQVIDAAGNRSLTPLSMIRVDTNPPKITISASWDLFSPNGDGFKDDVSFAMTYRNICPIGLWSVKIRDTNKRTVTTFAGSGSLPSVLQWKGTDDVGQVLPDGNYTYVFTAADEVGNKASTNEQILRIDNTPPNVTLSANPTLFAPIGNSAQNATTFAMDAKDASNLSKWRLVISGRDIAYKTMSGVGAPPKNEPWDGRSDHGQVVPDGDYIAVLSVTDEVGNTGKSPRVALRVDTTKPLVTVTAETTPLEELSPLMTVTELKNRDLVISMAMEVLFDSGEAVIKTQAYPTLMQAINLVQRYPKRKMRIDGHADNLPIHTEHFHNNKELSEARAKAVMTFFHVRGDISLARMSAHGYGDTRPRASNATEEGRHQNRRVEIILRKEEN